MGFEIDKNIFDLESLNVVNTTSCEDQSSVEEDSVEVKTNYFADINLQPNDFLEKLLLRRQNYLHERWDTVIIIDAKVLNVTDEFVECECLIDKEQNCFQNRIFPKYLFDDITNLKLNPFVRINIKSKVGSTRIDIYDGKNTVDPNPFNTNHLWEEFKGTDFGKPLDAPIKP